MLTPQPLDSLAVRLCELQDRCRDLPHTCALADRADRSKESSCSGLPEPMAKVSWPGAFIAYLTIAFGREGRLVDGQETQQLWEA